MHAFVSSSELTTRLCYIVMEGERGSLQRAAAISDPASVVQMGPKTWWRGGRRRPKEVPKSNPEPQLAQISSKNLGDSAALY